MQQEALSKIIWRRFSAKIQKLAAAVRKIRFRQVAGVMFILKPFAPLIVMLILGFFLYFMVLDFRADPEITAGLSSISAKMVVFSDGIKTVQQALGGLGDAFDEIKKVLDGILKALSVILIPVRAVIDLWNWCPVCPGELPEINLTLPILPDIAASFSGITALSDAISGITGDISTLGIALRNFFGRWWRYFQIMVVVFFVWWTLTIIANAYHSIRVGVEMLRGASPGGKTVGGTSRHWRNRPVFETPPILVVDHTLTNVPVVHQPDKTGNKKRQTTILRQQRVLLSAQAVWPNRHLDLFHYELADTLSEEVWARFWENLIARGLERDAVQLIISPNATTLSRVTSDFLPNAKVQQSVKTTLVSG